MLNYLKSELYRTLHNKWTYLFIIICSFMLICSNIVLAAIKYPEPNFPYANTQFSISNFMGSIIYVYILCITVASIVFGKEYSNHTMKNSISYGISRATIYFSKLLITFLYAVVAFVIITGFHVASAYLLLENSQGQELQRLVEVLLATLPLLFFALATANCFAFMLEGSGAAIGADIGILIALPLITGFLGMKFELLQKLANLLPWNIINRIEVYSDHYVLPWEGNAGFYNCWLAGMIQMVLIIIIGYLSYRRKEIK